MAHLSSAQRFSTLNVKQLSPFVVNVELNRPEKRNAMNHTFWGEVKKCFDELAANSDCRCIMLSGAGSMFSAGIDLQSLSEQFMSQLADNERDAARKARIMSQLLAEYQSSFTAIEKCPKPVVAAVHGGCIGGGINLVAACDVRHCTTDAWFQIKEVQLGLAADVGVLQRMPKQVGNDSLTRELCFTGRKFAAHEALQIGLVSAVHANREQLLLSVARLAADIAAQSPVAVQGTKVNLNYSRDHSVDEGLHYMIAWNQCMLQSEDILKSFQAMMNKETPTFAKL